MAIIHFRDRFEAGERLAQALAAYANNPKAVVYALPRGGLVVGFALSNNLNIPLDIVIAHKVGHPQSSEYAVCAVTENGTMICNQDEIAHIDPSWLRKAIKKEEGEVMRRRKLFTPQTRQISASGRIAIIVDDGVSTGLTLEAAIQSIKAMQPEKIIVAVPVAAHEAVDRLAPQVHQFVTLERAKPFLGAVGAYYSEFPQVGDDEVINMLKLSQKRTFK